MPVNPEYLRRNLLVCKAVGANANTKAARDRLLKQKRPPQWLVTYLDGIIERTEPLIGALACYRAVVPRDLADTRVAEEVGKCELCRASYYRRAQIGQPCEIQYCRGIVRIADTGGAEP